MPPKPIPDFDVDFSLNEGFEVDLAYGQRLLHNKEREDLQRFEEKKKKGLVDDEDDSDEDNPTDSDFGGRVDDEDDSDEDNPTDSEIDSDFGGREIDHKLLDVMNKVKNNDPSITNKDVKFFQSVESDKVNKKDKKKEKKMYLKDVQALQLLEKGPEYVEDDEERRTKTYAERQKELRKAVTDAVEAGGNESDEDGDDLLRVAEKEGNHVEFDEELAKKFDEFHGEEAEVFEKQFLKDYLLKQMWKEKDVKSIDDAELDELEKDEKAVWDQEDYERETNFRHEENAGEIVMGQSRKVEGSVRKVDNARKAKRKSKEERTKLAEIERKEELKRLKNAKKKDIKKKMKKVLSVAGFKDGEECPLDANDFDDEFDPEEYDKMMKAAFDDKYYDAEDSDLNSDDDDDHDEKPDFDKEDELLGLPKDWDVIQGRDGFVSARENVLKLKKNGSSDDDEEEVENEEEKEEEGKRKRKRKTSLVQRAKEAMMEEYYKLDYEDTIGDLKTRFKYAKVQPNKYELETEEVLTLDDTELNQYVPLKKMAPYVEKDWEVNKYKVKEQKQKIKELLEGKHDEMKSKKKRKKSEIEPTQKPEVEEEADESKLSRKAKRRRRQAEKKLPPNRMAAYGKVVKN